MPKVLIIEDNEESRQVLARRLERHGFNAVCACNGEQGVAMAQSENPDIILMDMNMPVLDGWQATREINALEPSRHAPIIGLTGHATEGDRERAIAAGCADYHTKPVQFERLLEQIETVMKTNSRSGTDPLEGTVITT